MRCLALADHSESPATSFLTSDVNADDYVPDQETSYSNLTRRAALRGMQYNSSGGPHRAHRKDDVHDDPLAFIKAFYEDNDNTINAPCSKPFALTKEAVSKYKVELRCEYT